jgi:CRP/FNR family transcriptional regulator
LEDAEEWLSELATGSARRRMLRLMMKLASLTPPNEASWLPKREEMGAMLGLTLETASRLVSQFKRENLILRMDARQLWLDVSALTEAAVREDRLD